MNRSSVHDSYLYIIDGHNIGTSENLCSDQIYTIPINFNDGSDSATPKYFEPVNLRLNANEIAIEVNEQSESSTTG